MCGGFKFSKNALIALNILYIVSYYCNIPSYSTSRKQNHFLSTVGWIYSDWCGHLWKSCKYCNQPSYYWRHCGLWCFSLNDSHHGANWSSQASSSFAFLRKSTISQSDLISQTFSLNGLIKFCSIWWSCSFYSFCNSALLVLVLQLMMRHRYVH